MKVGDHSDVRFQCLRVVRHKARNPQKPIMLTHHTDELLAGYISASGLSAEHYLFPSPHSPSAPIRQREFRRIWEAWIWQTVFSHQNLKSYAEAAREINSHYRVLFLDGYDSIVVPSRGAYPILDLAQTLWELEIRSHKDFDARWAAKSEQLSSPIHRELTLPFSADPDTTCQTSSANSRYGAATGLFLRLCDSPKRAGRNNRSCPTSPRIPRLLARARYQRGTRGRLGLERAAGTYDSRNAADFAASLIS